MERKTTDVDKAGMQTSEFWVAILSPVLIPIIMVIVNKYGFPITEEAITAMVVGVIAPMVAYVLGRASNKNNVAKIRIAEINSEAGNATPGTGGTAEVNMKINTETKGN